VPSLSSGVHMSVGHIVGNNARKLSNVFCLSSLVSFVYQLFVVLHQYHIDGTTEH